MSEETENLVLEPLRTMWNDIQSIRDDVSTVKSDLTYLREEVGELRDAVAGVAYAVAHQQGQFSARIERLEEKAGL